MAYWVERISGEPVVYITVQGKLSVREARGLYAEMARKAAAIEGHVYHIADLREMDPTFHAMNGIVHAADRVNPGAAFAPSVSVVFVANDHLGSTSGPGLRMWNLGTIRIPVFPEPDDALRFVRRYRMVSPAHDAPFRSATMKSGSPCRSASPGRSFQRIPTNSQLRPASVE